VFLIHTVTHLTGEGFTSAVSDPSAQSSDVGSFVRGLLRILLALKKKLAALPPLEGME
jgi:hypothetical protein